MHVLSPAQQQLLLYLAEYKYLKTSQIVRLGGVCQRAWNLSHFMARLPQSPELVQRLSFAHLRKENVYCLSEAGARCVERDLLQPAARIKYPKNSQVRFERDYDHRFAVIDVELALKQGLSKRAGNCRFFERYFDAAAGKATAQRWQAATRLELSPQTIIQPDAAGWLETPARPWLFLLEVSLGQEVARILEQNRQHALALAADLPSRHYQFPRGCLILCVFEQEPVMRRVMEQMRQDRRWQNFAGHFWFKTCAAVRQGFFERWLTFHGEVKSF